MNKLLDLFQMLIRDQNEPMSKDLLEHLLDGTSDLIFLMGVNDDSYQYAFMNNAAKQHLQIDCKWLGETLEDVLPEDHCKHIKEKYNEAKEAKESVSYEDQAELNGSIFYGHNILSPLLNDEGECTHILSITRDITDRKLKERELTRVNELYSSLMTNSADAILILSNELEIVELNPAFEDIYGWSKAELQETNLPFIPENKEEEAKALLRQVLNGDKISGYETQRLKKDGVLVDVSISMSPLYNTNQEVVGVSSLIRNITEQKRIENKLEKSKSRYESLFKYNPDPVLQMDLHGVIQKANPSCERILGQSVKELRNTSILELVTDQEIEHVRHQLQMLKQQESTIFETKLHCNHYQGHVRTFDVVTFPIVLNQELHGAYFIMQDKTEKVEVFDALQKSEEKYRLIADHSFDLITVHDTKGYITYASPSHCYLVDEDPTEIQNQPLTFQIHEEDQKSLKKSFFESLMTLESFSIKLRKKNSRNEWVWHESKGTPVEGEGGKVSHVVIVSRDISEQINYEEQLKEIAYFDHLTNLPNRRLFEDRLNQMLAHSNRSNRSFALMYLDGDEFKEINDDLGHGIGDEYLYFVGKRIKKWMREEDTVARIGGDEFAVILTNIETREEAERVAKRLQQSLSQPYNIKGVTIQSSFSIGISLFPEDGQTKEQVIQHADKALYYSKEKGKNEISTYQDILSHIQI